MNITVNKSILYSFIPFRKTRNKKTLGKKRQALIGKRRGVPGVRAAGNRPKEKCMSNASLWS